MNHFQNQLPLLLLVTFSMAMLAQASTSFGQNPWLVFEPTENINGKHVVIVSGDEEYRG